MSTLSKLYSNKPDIFEPIRFVEGLNVVEGQIRLPENKNVDSHNLGKTTLGKMLDFMLLEARAKDFFLFKHEDLFRDFIFFIEVRLERGGCVTMRRTVVEASKVSFKRHVADNQDFSSLSEKDWDHFELPFEKSKQLADSWLNWRGLSPWGFRHGLRYGLRTQNDFADIFKIGQFSAPHADWKPFLAHILGFDSAAVVDHYDTEEKITKEEQTAETISREMGGNTVDDVTRIDGLLSIQREAADKKQKLIDAFDFRPEDKRITKEVVDELDEKLAELSSRRYTLLHNRKKVKASLEEEQLLFRTDEAEKLFGEAGVLFQGQIKKDFEQLIQFNKAITEERRGYLFEELAEIEADLKEYSAEINSLGKKRSEALSFLSSTDVFDKYRKASEELVGIRAEILSLERQKELLTKLQEIRTQIRVLKEKRDGLQVRIEKDVEKQSGDSASRFYSIRQYFNEFVEAVINRRALLSVVTNTVGHLEFKAEILNAEGLTTDAAMGMTYKKLLCMAFDLAVLRAHLKEPFPRFVFHDGALEGLDDRKKENLVEILREYATLGLQPIITLIDSDMPKATPGSPPLFQPEEIILTLHDEGEKGRLFKMKDW